MPAFPALTNVLQAVQKMGETCAAVQKMGETYAAMADAAERHARAFRALAQVVAEHARALDGWRRGLAALLIRALCYLAWRCDRFATWARARSTSCPVVVNETGPPALDALTSLMVTGLAPPELGSNLGPVSVAA
jgi:hypothetical protein